MLLKLTLVQQMFRKTSYRVLIGPLVQKLMRDFHSFDHPDSRKVYVYVEYVWPELQGPQTYRISIVLVWKY